MAITSHVEEIKEELIIEKSSAMISNLGWDFIFGYNFFETTHSICLKALLFAFINSPCANHTHNSQWFENLNKEISIG